MKTKYHILIIGSGPGGYRAAVLAALRNQKVAIIEKQDWGGCCLNRGCVPKKAWYNTAKILSKNNTMNKIGIKGDLKPDFDAAWQHQKNTVTTVRDSYLNYMSRLGIDFFDGHGKIINNHTVSISNIGSEEKLLTTENIIIATGSAPYVPEPFSVTGKRVLTTDDMFDTPPPTGKNIAIIGGGVIASEFSFILQMLGKNVQWFSRSGMLSKSTFSPQAISALSNKLRTFSLEPKQKFPVSVKEKEKQVALQFEHSTPDQTFDWILLATGRKPVTHDLGLENTRIKPDKQGFIPTNEFLQTLEPNIYAIGDVRSRQMTANQAIADANVAIENIINGNQERYNETWTPQAIYSALELAKVGLNEEEAEDLEHEPAIGFTAFESSPSAIGQNETDGYIRLISDMDSGEFLGGEIIGENAAELIQLMALQAHNKQSALKTFAQLMVNHPTRGEELVNTTETLASKWGLSEFIFSTKET